MLVRTLNGFGDIYASQAWGHWRNQEMRKEVRYWRPWKLESPSRRKSSKICWLVSGSKGVEDLYFYADPFWADFRVKKVNLTPEPCCWQRALSSVCLWADHALDRRRLTRYHGNSVGSDFLNIPVCFFQCLVGRLSWRIYELNPVISVLNVTTPTLTHRVKVGFPSHVLCSDWLMDPWCHMTHRQCGSYHVVADYPLQECLLCTDWSLFRPQTSTSVWWLTAQLVFC